MGKSKIYTGSGDKGMTSLVGGYRVPKTHPRVEAYGTMDELNAFIGLLATEIEDNKTFELLLFIQSKLFAIGSYLATDPAKISHQIENPVTNECIKIIEEAIDQVDSELPKLKSFVLPGGTRAAALAHICRTVCRRAERTVFHLAETEKVDEKVLIFVNRLSDFLFVIARKDCVLKKGEEIFLNNICI